MPNSKSLDSLRALPLPNPVRVVADSLAHGQRELDGLRTAGAAAGNILTRRDQMLAAVDLAIGKHYSSLRQGPTVALRAIEREYRRVPASREAEQRAAIIAAFTDDLALMGSSTVATLAGDVVAGRLPDAFTRSHVAAVARECRLRGDALSADAIGEAYPFDPEPWKADPRWREASKRLEAVERFTGDTRTIAVTDAKGKVRTYPLDDLLV